MSDTDTEEMQVVAYADFPSEQRFTFKITPLPGRLLSAETIGGTLLNVAKMVKAANREYVRGSRFIAVCGIRLCDDGAFEADLVELPVQKRPTHSQGEAK
jgi:hypothetical protein